MKRLTIQPAVLLLGLCPLIGVSHSIMAEPQPNQGNRASSGGQPVERPMTREDLMLLVRSNVSSMDILVEASQRGIAEVIDANTLEKLEKEGADSLLLNQVSAYSIAVAPRLRDLEVFAKEQRFDRVLELAEELVQESPRLLPAWYAKSEAHFERSEPIEAERIARRLLEFAPDSSGHRFLLARSLRASDRIGEAIDELTDILRRNSTSALSLRDECHWLRGQLLAKQGDFRQAADDYLRALVFAPMNSAILSSTAELFSRSADPAVRSPDAAIQFATALLLMSNDDRLRVLAQVRLAEAFASKDDFASARKHIERTKAFTVPADLKQPLGALQTEIDANQFEFWPMSAASSTSGDLNTLASLRGNLVRIPPRGESVDPVPFFLSNREVTRGQWADVMGLPRPIDADLPQDQISWLDALAFIEKLNQRPEARGLVMRLPTSREWEVAFLRENADAISPSDSVMALEGWLRENSARRLHPVATLPPSPWSLHDMVGNVAEWCDDRYQAEQGRTVDDSPFRVVRGGGFASGSEERSDRFLGFAPASSRWRGLGLRLAANIPNQAEVASGSLRQGEWGVERAIDLAIRLPEWDPLAGVGGSHLSGFQLLLMKIAIESHEANWEGAMTSARRLVREVDLADPQAADFGRCLLALLSTRRPAIASDTALLREVSEMVDSVRGKNGFGYWFAEYARAALLRVQRDWPEAKNSAQRALDLAPVAFKPTCRELLALIDRQDTSATLDPPSLAESLMEGLLPASQNP